MGICGSKPKPNQPGKAGDPKAGNKGPEKEGDKGKEGILKADPHTLKDVEKDADNNKKATLGELAGHKPTGPEKKDDPLQKPTVGIAY
jgi:hypothetical protein